MLAGSQGYLCVSQGITLLCAAMTQRQIVSWSKTQPAQHSLTAFLPPTWRLLGMHMAQMRTCYWSLFLPA